MTACAVPKWRLIRASIAAMPYGRSGFTRPAGAALAVLASACATAATTILTTTH